MNLISYRKPYASDEQTEYLAKFYNLSVQNLSAYMHDAISESIIVTVR